MRMRRLCELPSAAAEVQDLGLITVTLAVHRARAADGRSLRAGMDGRVGASVRRQRSDEGATARAQPILPVEHDDPGCG